MNDTNRDSLASILDSVLSGDVNGMTELAAVSPSALRTAARELGSALEVNAGAVALVLQSLLEREAPLEVYQAWGSFVRRGYLEGIAAGPSLDIHYEVAREQEIADAVGRLDELGDVVDGEIGDHEALSLMRRLRGQDREM